MSFTTGLKRKGNNGSAKNVCQGLDKNCAANSRWCIQTLTLGLSISSMPSISQSVNKGSSSDSNFTKSTTGPFLSISSRSSSIFRPTLSLIVATYAGKKKSLCCMRISRCSGSSKLINELKAAGISFFGRQCFLSGTARLMLPRCDEKTLWASSTSLMSSYRVTDQKPEMSLSPVDHITGACSRIFLYRSKG